MPPPGSKTLADLVDRVYAAALDPREWEPLLEALCDTLECKSAALATYDFQTRLAQLHAAAHADPTLLPLYEHYSPKNPLMPAVAAHVATGVVAASADHVADRDLFRTEYFNEYMRRAGYHHNLALCLARTGDVATMVYPVREIGRPTFSKRDLELCRALVPHLGRAFLIQRRLAEAGVRASTAEQVLDQLALGVCVLDRRGRVIFTNRSARETFDAHDGIAVERDGLAVAHATDRVRLHRAVAEATRATGMDRPPLGRALRVGRPSLRRAFEVLVVPLSDQRDWIPDLAEAAAVLFIGDPERRSETWDALLMRLYDLTASEARTAVLLLQGYRVQEIAEELAVSLNTTRTHLKRIFGKTGARTQSDLMRLLLSGPAQLRTMPR